MKKRSQDKESLGYLSFNYKRENRGIVGNLVVSLIRKKYGVGNHHELYLRYFIEKLGLEGKGRSICEIGGGDGWAISYKSPLIKEKVMVDYDDYYGKMLEREGIKFIHKPLGKGILKGLGEFDIVMINHVLEHVPNYEIAVKELYSLTKKGGFVIVRCPNIKKVKFIFWDDPTHCKPYSPKSLETVFRKAGFETVLLKEFSYDWFVLGFLLGKRLQDRLMGMNAGEILYIGRRPG